SVSLRIPRFASQADDAPRETAHTAIFRLIDQISEEGKQMAKIRSLVPFGRGSLMRDYDPFTGFRHEMDRMLEDFGRGLPAAVIRGNDEFLLPKVDVAETDAGLELTAELPGFDEKDVSLDIHEGVLTIKAEHNEEREDKDEKKRYHLVERSKGTFLR